MAPSGKPTTELEKVGPFRGHGTSIYFEPDAEIFKTTRFDAKQITSHLEDMSYIHNGLKIIFKDEVAGETHDLTHPGGIPEFLGRLVTEGLGVAQLRLIMGTSMGCMHAFMWAEAWPQATWCFARGLVCPTTCSGPAVCSWPRRPASATCPAR